MLFHTALYFYTDVLPQPISAPVLKQIGSQKIFDISVPIELQMYNNPSLVFQIQTLPGEYFYQWMVDVIFDLPEVALVQHLLDLNAFIGLTVNVSFAFATEQGISEYSQPTEVHLFEEIVPTFPSDSAHALVTMSIELAQDTALCHVSCTDSSLTNSTSEFSLKPVRHVHLQL